MDGLMENDTLAVLDLSWNCLGLEGSKCVDRLCDLFKKNKSIVHLDLSSNFFNKD